MEREKKKKHERGKLQESRLEREEETGRVRNGVRGGKWIEGRRIEDREGEAVGQEGV